MDAIAPYARDELWAPTEKKLARMAFDKAFARQCAAIAQEARRMLEMSTAPATFFACKNILPSKQRLSMDIMITGIRGCSECSADCYRMDG
jgi:hypothetical protein